MPKPKRKPKATKPLTIYQAPIDRKALDAMPVEARRMMLLLGHIGNDLNTQNRLLLLHLQNPRNQYVRKYNEVRTASVLRNLIGITFEGLRAIQASFIGTPLGRGYQAHLKPEGQDALKKVRQHLGNLTLIAAIRNSFAFHLPKPGQIDHAYSKIPADVELSIFTGSPRQSSLYEMSNLMITSGMTELVDGAKDYHDAMDRIVTDTLDKAGDLGDLIEQILITIVEQHKLPVRLKKVATIRNAPSVKTFKIPPLLGS